ncbi:hypothetical protein EMCRGX_G033559, partial [Ephydatia muelleri]
TCIIHIIIHVLNIMYEDKAWVDAKLDELDRKLNEVGSSLCDEEQRYNIFKLTFDEVLERLPAAGPVLSQIKLQYESVIDGIVQKKRNATRFEQNQLTRFTEEGTIRNYLHYITEIELKLTQAREECSRIQNELETMSNERIAAKHKYETKVLQHRTAKPHMTSTKRQLLRLQGKEATDMACLERELQRVKLELEEAKATSERRYVAVQRKHTLQRQLEEKEEVKAGLVERARLLRCTLTKLNIACEAVLEYTKGEFFHTNLADFVIDALAKLNGVEDSIEDEDDPEKEREAEVVLDCFESFNDLFQDGLYEQAAIMAANSPKGVLRSHSIMEKFKGSAKPQNGEKCPLLMYCKALLEAAAVYKPLSVEESLVCAECIIQQEVDGSSGLAHWIEQRVLPTSTQLGKLIYSQCKCSKRCGCGYKGLAFSVFDRCNSFQQAALCLVELNKYASFMALGERAKFSKEDYANVLYSAPSLELAVYLVSFPHMSASVLTLFEAMHLLSVALTAAEGVKLLEKCSKQMNQSVMTIILEDDRTSWDIWQSLIHHLQSEGFDDWAVDIYAALVVKMTITQVMDSIKQKQHVTDSSQYQNPSRHDGNSEVDAESSIHPESTAPSGYNSSSDEDNSQNASEEDTQEAGDEHSSGDQSSEP